jgi:hypothetical protein
MILRSVGNTDIQGLFAANTMQVADEVFTNMTNFNSAESAQFI